MVSNGVYQRKGEGGVTSGTHFSSHSLISDNNDNRDYEVVDVADSKHDYHRLHRPSPPMLPSGRNATFSFASPKEFQSMSTLTSRLGNKPLPSQPGNLLTSQPGNPATKEMLQRGEIDSKVVFPMVAKNSTSRGLDNHVYRELEMTSVDPTSGGGTVKDIYRSPTSTESPGSLRGPNNPAEPHHVFDYQNESLYSPRDFESARIQQGGLINVPETGTMFHEPDNPMAFPTHNYEMILPNSKEYETPICTRKKSSSSPAPPAAATPSESRPRADSSARYEMQASMEESQYSKLTHPTVGSAAIATQQPIYSELSTQSSTGTPPENGSFSLQEMPKLSGMHDPTTSNGLTVPSHVGVAVGVVDNRGPSVSSATDSLASYIAHLQTNSQPMATNCKIENFLVEGPMTSPGAGGGAHYHHPGCERKASLEAEGAEPRKSGLKARAWSEEREDPFLNMNGLSRSDFAGFSDVLGGNRNHERQASAPMRVHRDLQPNGLDPRLGEFVRSKTMV